MRFSRPNKRDQRSDVVTIATPNGFHAPYAVKLSAGYHVVIEKPRVLTALNVRKSLLLKKKRVSMYLW